VGSGALACRHVVAGYDAALSKNDARQNCLNNPSAPMDFLNVISWSPQRTKYNSKSSIKEITFITNRFMEHFFDCLNK
jgi:hypothetical protein